jgi:glycerophosphoryl diester phosphodiesterase
LIAGLAAGLAPLAASAQPPALDFGARPAFLVNDMRAGPLQARLAACLGDEPRRSSLSIGHRGAGLRYAEHTREAYEAGARMGAGVLECDVTFTKDLELVCRHSQNDLATTTNILLTPLASTCVRPFRPAVLRADGRVVRAARAECRTSELTLAEFKSLRGKIDAFNPAARTPGEFVVGEPTPRPGFDAGQATGTLLSHAESIALFRELGVKMTPELKAPSVRMPFRGLTREQLAAKLVAEYRDAGVDPADVFPQSFAIRDVRYWTEHEPDFGRQAVLLDNARLPVGVPGRRRFARYAAEGVHIWAPPLFALLALDAEGRIVPSKAARRARAAGLELWTWTLERSGDLAASDSGLYYRTIDDAVTREGDVLNVVDVLVRDAGVRGIFSDWPATVSFYASCAAAP